MESTSIFTVGAVVFTVSAIHDCYVTPEPSTIIALCTSILYMMGYAWYLYECYHIASRREFYDYQPLERTNSFIGSSIIFALSGMSSTIGSVEEIVTDASFINICSLIAYSVYLIGYGFYIKECWRDSQQSLPLYMMPHNVLER